jgi:hypothetical protein
MPGQGIKGGAWNRDGEIIFGAYGGSNAVMRVSAAGGTASALTTLNRARQEMTHIAPEFLPDGRHFLYFCKSGIPENTGLYVGSLDVGTEQQSSKRLIPSATFGVCSIPSRDSGPGHLLYQRGWALVAQAFDVEQYAPAPDGKRFLFQVPNLQGSKAPFAVILNWTSLLKK